MSDEHCGDFSHYNADSVPEPEKPIEHHHPGRPDLDYDDTPVGPATEVRECHQNYDDPSRDRIYDEDPEHQ